MRFLRTNTAVIITVGPFYDKTDGVTIETALTITNERITLTADTDAGSAPTNILDNVTGATSGTANDLNYITGNDAGMMQLELAAADTNRLGRMMLSITDAANHVPVFHEFMVVNAALYDAFFASSGGAIPNAVAGAAGGVFIAGTNAATTITTALTTTFTGNLTGSVGSVTTGGITTASFAAGAINAAAIAADAIGASELAADAVAEIADAVWDELKSGHTTANSFGDYLDVEVSSVSGGSITSIDLGIIDTGTAQGAADSTHIQLRAAAAFANDEIVGATVLITGGTGIGQSRVITDYVSSTDTALIDPPWTTTPSGTITYNLFGTPPGTTTSLPAVNATQFAGQTITAAAGVTLPSSVASPTNITAGTLTTVTTATNVTTVNGLAANVITAAATAADFTTEIQAGLATAAALTTVDDFLDTEVAALTTELAKVPKSDGTVSLNATVLAAIQSGLATSAALTTIDDFLDTEVAAIKAKTDSLNFTVAGQVDANIQSVNDITVNGTGVAGSDPWGP